MRQEISKFSLIVDPLDMYEAPISKLLEGCGYALNWVLDLPAGQPIIPHLDKSYRHGGGWYDFTGFTVNPDGSLSYPGDPDLYPLVEVQHGQETFRMYPHAWVAVTQADGKTRICRMD